MMGRILLLLSVLTLTPHVSVGQADGGPVAIISPLGYNASLNSSGTVTFHCSVTGALALTWTVDRLPSDSPAISGRGIQTSTIPVEGSLDSFESDLTIPTTFANDNSSVQCSSFASTGSNMSIVAILQIQGLLGEPPNLMIRVLNETHRQLTWDPPFTLDITDQDPDIIAYTVCNNITGSCENTTETQLIFPNLAVQIEFNVTAINIVGEGNTSTVVSEACEPATELDDMGITIVTVTVSFVGASLNVEIKFLQESMCFHIHMVETVANSSGNATMHGPLIPEVFQQDSMAHVTLTLDSTLEENDCHYATIIFIYEGGTTSLDPRINFTTFDVQSVEVTVDAGAIVVTLTFAAGSQALGFHLLIIPLSGEMTQNVSRNVRVEQTGATPTVFEHRETGLDTGEYMVQIFDWESDGTIDFDNMVHVEQVTITENPGSPTPPTTSTPSTRDSTTPTDSSGPEDDVDNTVAIAGGVVAVLVAMVIIASVVGVCICCSCSTRKETRTRMHHHFLTQDNLDHQLQVITDSGTGNGTQLNSLSTPTPPSSPSILTARRGQLNLVQNPAQDRLSRVLHN